MPDPVTRLSLSPEADDRVRAARLGARQASGDNEVMVVLESLLDSELDNVEVRETIVHVLLDTEESHETVGALEAIGWIAPSGGFAASETALARVDELSDHTDGLVRGLARKAREALAEP